MSNLQTLQAAESAAQAAIEAAVSAVDKLYEQRANIPKLVNEHRQTAAHEHHVERFADSLHAHETGLARHLLSPLSGTELGKLILAHASQVISPYHRATPWSSLPPAA